MKRLLVVLAVVMAATGADAKARKHVKNTDAPATGAVQNPDGTIGFFRGVMSSGTKPIRPEWGYAILHNRCAHNLGLTACDGTTGVLT